MSPRGEGRAYDPMAINPNPISDALWQRIETLIGQEPSESEKKVGRRPISKRTVVETLIHKLKFGFTWSIIQNGHTTFRWAKTLSKETLAAFLDAILAASDELELTEAHIKTIEGYFDLYFFEDSSVPTEPTKSKKRKTSKEKYPRKQQSSYRDKSRQIETIWTVEADLAAKIEPIINELCPIKKTGRRRTQWIQVFNAIIWKVRTGCQWRGLPQTYGSRTTIRRWRQKWEETGVLRQIHEILVQELDNMGQVDWNTNIVDGALIKARRGGELTGPSPIDRAKPGSKISVISDGNGLPLGFTIAGANVSDVTLLEETLANRIKPNREIVQTLFLDRGYRGEPARLVTEQAGFVYKRPLMPDNSPYAEIVKKQWSKADRIKRSKIEPGNAWLQNFKSVLTRYDRKAVNYRANVHIAMILIIWRRIKMAELDVVEDD
jgi:putative transposase